MPVCRDLSQRADGSGATRVLAFSPARHCKALLGTAPQRISHFARFGLHVWARLLRRATNGVGMTALFGFPTELS